MNRDQLITLLADPDTVAQGIQELSTYLDVQDKRIEQLTASNDKLRDLNTQFALKATVSKSEPEPEPVLSPEDKAKKAFDDAWDKWRNK